MITKGKGKEVKKEEEERKRKTRRNKEKKRGKKKLSELIRRLCNGVLNYQAWGSQGLGHLGGLYSGNSCAHYVRSCHQITQF